MSFSNLKIFLLLPLFLFFIGCGSGATGTAGTTDTADTTAPSAPVISAPTDGTLTNNTAHAVSGTAEADSTVELFDGTTSLGTVTPNVNGDWSIVNSTLADGAHSLTATATDAAGNVSVVSTAVSITVDATVPDVPVISAPIDGTSTNNTAPAVSGTAEVDSTVELFDGTTSLGTATPDANGDWSIVSSTLAEGAHSFTAKATDPAGNSGLSSTAVSITVDTVAPTVAISDVFPLVTATDATVVTAVSATFNEVLEAVTVDTASFTLVKTSDSSAVAGTVGLTTGNITATFVPLSRLEHNTPYTATLTTAITDVADNSFLGTAWSFTTRDWQWWTAGLVETDNSGHAYNPQVVIDPSGNAIAVWKQHDGTRYNIWTNRYTVGTGWGTAELLETDNAGNAAWPQVAIDPSGNAFAVWSQSDGTRDNLWANRYTAGTGWGTAELLETDNAGTALFPQIAIDSSGNAIVVWQQSDGTRSSIYRKRYTDGTGWGTVDLLEIDNAGDAVYPQIAIDPSGNAVAVWYQSDGTLYNIWANRYTAGTGWGIATFIETDNTGGTGNPQVAIDSSGNAIAVWQQSDGTRYNIMTNRYTAGTGWGTAELLETDNAGTAYYNEVAIDSSGNAIAVWSQSDGTRHNIWANRYTAGTGWGTAELIETDNTGGATAPQVAFDPSGNAFAVWQQNDGTRDNIWANRYTAGTGWGTAELLETDNAGTAWYPEVVIDSNGNAVAVWQQHDGTRYNIWANIFE